MSFPCRSKKGSGSTCRTTYRSPAGPPRSPASPYAVVGLYLYDSQVFDIIRGLKPSERGELEISAVNGEYIARHQLEYDVYPGRWMDAGTMESWFEANRLFYGEG